MRRRKYEQHVIIASAKGPRELTELTLVPLLAQLKYSLNGYEDDVSSIIESLIPLLNPLANFTYIKR